MYKYFNNNKNKK